VILAGRPHGAVVTLRDRTEMAALMRELDGERGLIESLRAQHHEFSNRMHVIAGLLELGHADDARDYLMEIQGTAAELDNSLRASIASPQVVGLLLGKAAEASERGIRLEITPETWLSESPVKIQVLTLVLGNLVDNAMDAVAAAPQGGRVEIGILEDEEAITIVVTDNGPGVAPELVPRIFLDGYSTKGHQGGSLRGLGLALVHRMVTHSDGSVQVTRAKTGGARFTVVIPKRQARRESTSNAKVPAR
jgi:two-component system CitB family sensor kinase